MRIKRDYDEALYYIGMTETRFRDRLKEHIKDIKYGMLATALTRLHSTHVAQIDLRNASIICLYNTFL